MTTSDILDRTAGALTASSVFGPPQHHDGITVIPAAAVRGGGGGGGGSDDNDESGEGGGFGLAARPAGAIVIDGDNVTWKTPPIDLTRIIIGGQIVVVAFFLFRWLTERARAGA